MSIFNEEDRPVPLTWQKGCRRGCTVIGVIALVLLATAHVVVGGALVNYSKDIRGRVIDEKTGRPLGGVVLLAKWSGRGLTGAYHFAFASEAVSQADGTYVLAGMPWRIRRPFEHWKFEDPEIYVYKPGYRAGRLTNRGLAEWPNGGPEWTMRPERHCFWQGKAIPMYPVTTVEEAAQDLVIIENEALGWPKQLYPNQYPLMWDALLGGARTIPPNQFSLNAGDPTPRYRFLMEKRK